MKYSTQNKLFDEIDKLDQISKLKDPLEKLNECIDWNIFTPELMRVFPKMDHTHGDNGRPKTSVMLLFKAIIIQRLYALSDDDLEYQITDRRSFARFLGLNPCDKVPDSKTFWAFRNELALKKSGEILFNLFSEALLKKGVISQKGIIVDASFVQVPIQRNKKEDNLKIKEGEVPKGWSENKLAQKDVDARWTKKNNKSYFGYKNHIKVDVNSKFITGYAFTTASVHDSQAVPIIITEEDKGKNAHMDSAYVGPEVEKILNSFNITPYIIEKGYKNNPLTEEQKLTNHTKSKIRARVEHVFGAIKMQMGGLFSKSIGAIRNELFVGLQNLVYNINRCVSLRIVL
jgi:transposase, IS5 family